MSNVIISGDGKILGIPTQFGIGSYSDSLVIIGTLDTEGRSLSETLDSKDLAISNLIKAVSVIPQSNNSFEAKFISSADKSVFAIDSSGLAIYVVASPDSRQVFIALNTDALKSDNSFEKHVAEIGSWLGVKTLLLAMQDKGSFDTSLIPKLSPSFADVSIPSSQQKYPMLAYSLFDLSESSFGKSIKALTSLEKLHFCVGASQQTGDFNASLLGDEIKVGIVSYKDFELALKKKDANISCQIKGSLNLDLGSRNLGFDLAGGVSTTSVGFSASSNDDSRIEINSQIALSSLSLSIGSNETGPTLAMTGAASIGDMYIFAGAALTPKPPYISLISAAITSTQKKIWLKDIVINIADITTTPSIDCLDMVAVADFEINDITVPDAISAMPSEDSENYPDKKEDVIEQTKKLLNQKIDSSLSITGDAELTRIGGKGSKQYILTDKAKMRHYRVDNNGKVTLSSQLYLCNSKTEIGDQTMDVGMFMCGMIEIFGKKTKFLFLIDKGKSLVAFVKLPPITLFEVITIKNSDTDLQIDSSISNNKVNQTFIGDLSGANDKNGDGAVLYLNIQREKGEVTFFVSASIDILGIFQYDAFIAVVDRMVCINVEKSVCGFKTIFSVKSKFDGFGTDDFAARLVFNIDGFSGVLKKAQAELTKKAKSIEADINKATKGVKDAKNKVNSLQKNINSNNTSLEKRRKERDNCSWRQIKRKISLGIKIVCLEVNKKSLSIAIGVAKGVLTIAEKAVSLGGKIATTTMKSIAYLLNATTQILWIKSFTLGIDISNNKKVISSDLRLTLFGKDVAESFDIDPTDGIKSLDALVGKVSAKVQSIVTEKSNQLFEDIKSGKVHRSIENDLDIEEKDEKNQSDLIELEEAIPLYNEFVGTRNIADNFFADASALYFDAYNEEDADAIITASELTEMHWIEEQNNMQTRELLDDTFIEELKNVLDGIDKAEGVNRDPMELASRRNMFNSIKEFAAQKQNGADETLLGRINRSNTNKRASRRSRAANDNISAEQANATYAYGVLDLVKKHFGDDDENPPRNSVESELRRTIANAAQQFANNSKSTFRKR